MVSSLMFLVLKGLAAAEYLFSLFVLCAVALFQILHGELSLYKSGDKRQS